MAIRSALSLSPATHPASPAAADQGPDPLAVNLPNYIPFFQKDLWALAVDCLSAQLDCDDQSYDLDHEEEANHASGSFHYNHATQHAGAIRLKRPVTHFASPMNKLENTRSRDRKKRRQRLRIIYGSTDPEIVQVSRTGLHGV